MVTKTFCDLCGKEIVEEGTNEITAFVGVIELKIYSTVDELKNERAWDSRQIHLCPDDLKKIKCLFRLEYLLR